MNESAFILIFASIAPLSWMFFLILTLSTLNLTTTIFKIIIALMRLGPLFHLLIYFWLYMCIRASDSNVTAINGTTTVSGNARMEAMIWLIHDLQTGLDTRYFTDGYLEYIEDKQVINWFLYDYNRVVLHINIHTFSFHVCFYYYQFSQWIQLWNNSTKTILVM